MLCLEKQRSDGNKVMMSPRVPSGLWILQGVLISAQPPHPSALLWKLKIPLHVAFIETLYSHGITEANRHWFSERPLKPVAT